MKLNEETAGDSMGRLDGKIALITGIGGGMGRAAAFRFAHEGARIVGCDLFPEAADETVRLVREAGGQIENFAPVDLSDAAAAARWIESAVQAFGGADILYNNASSPRFGDIQDLTVEDWDYVIANELNLVFYTTKAIWPRFMATGGVILNVGSIAGLRGVEFMSQNAHGTAKAGVLSLTRQLAAEGGKYGIRAVAVSPGFTVTPSTAWLVEGGPQPFKDMIARIPLGRVGQADDIVNAALFLASDEASWITGANLVVDGGGSTLG
ncbi:beta-ketoacyl-ACP reductase [soil metagenome]